MRIVHIADTHIHNLRYREEFKSVFNDLFDRLGREKPDIILHAGDVLHQKTQLTPEAVRLASYFFKSLSEIAPLYILLGNHDGLVRNKSRDNSVSSIVSAIGSNDIYVFEESETVDIPHSNISLTSFSIFGSQEDWKHEPDNADRVNIALYHGSVANEDSGVLKYDNGHTISTDDLLGVNMFENYDYAFLGHIHSRQDLNSRGTIAYAGSTVQTNFGEGIEKGYYIWDIQDKTNFSKEFIQLHNPHPFVTVEVESDYDTIISNIDSLIGDVIPDCRLRIVVRNDDVGYRDVENIFREIKKRVSLHSTAWVRGKSLVVKDSSDEEKVMSIKMNIESQNEMIEGVLKKKLNIKNESIIKEVVGLNKKYFEEEESSDVELKRNATWKINSVEWENLFRYEEDNRITFSDFGYGDMVGLFGENKTGKSSIIDAILFCLFGKTSKGGKNVNVINKRKNGGKVSVDMTIGDSNYRITRTCNRSTKKYDDDGNDLGNDPSRTDKTRTTVTFNILDDNGNVSENLIDVNRYSSDYVIQSHIGDYEDFLLGSLATQFDSLRFIHGTSTERKEILKRALDLDVLDERHDRAMSEFNYIKKRLKKESDIDYVSDIRLTNSKIVESKKGIRELKAQSGSIEEEIEGIREDIKNKEYEIRDLEQSGVGGVDIKDLQEKRDKFEDFLSRGNKWVKETEQKISDLKDEIKRGKAALDGNDIDKKRDMVEKIKELERDLTVYTSQEGSLKREVDRDEKQAEAKSSVPCVGTDMFHSCRYIKDVADIVVGLEDKQKRLNDISEKIRMLQKDIGSGNSVKEEYNRLKYISEKVSSDELELANISSSLEKNKSRIAEADRNLKDILVRIDNYEKFRSNIENLNKKKRELEDTKGELERKILQLKDKAADIISISKDVGVLETHVKTLKESLQEKTELERNYDIYSSYTRAIGKNGVTISILEKYIPVINREIESVLKGVVDFIVYFEISDGGKIELKIEDEHGSLPLITGSGMEKQIASIAIRLALINITSVPHTNIFIMDEPAVNLDEKNMSNFIKIMEVLRSKFESVMVITHMDQLKDAVDKIINVVVNEDGYAEVRQ